MVLAVLPLFVTAGLGAPALTVGLIEGIADGASAAVKVWSGWYSDRIPWRKSLAVGGYGATGFGFSLLLTVTVWPQVLLSRAFAWVGRGLRQPIRQAMLAAGARPSVTPMTLIFLAGPERYRQVLQPASDRPINEGEQVWLDGGCSVDGYRADFIRSGVIGRLSDKAEHYYDVAVQALDASVEALGPGRKLGESWSAAQACFDDAGVGAFTLIPGQIGHSIGLDHWELPLVGKPGTEQGEVVARPGMVLDPLFEQPDVVGADLREVADRILEREGA